MKLGICERTLPGETTADRLKAAHNLGADGVCFGHQALDGRLESVAEGLRANGLQSAGVHAGGTHLLHPEPAQRAEAISTLHDAMMTAYDLGTPAVTLYTHHAETPGLPDLMPYKSDLELQGELLVTQFRATLADFAWATDTYLYLAPRPHDEPGILHKLEHAAKVLRYNDNHPNLGIAADTYTLFREEDDPLAALRTHAASLGMVYLRDDDGGLFGHSGMDFAGVIRMLGDADYGGWLVIDSIQGDLPGAVESIRALLAG